MFYSKCGLKIITPQKSITMTAKIYLFIIIIIFYFCIIGKLVFVASGSMFSGIKVIIGPGN